MTVKSIIRLIQVRLIIAFSLLFSLFIIQLSTKELFPLFFFYSFLVFVFGLSVIYLVLYRLGVNPRWQIYIQLTGDFLLITYLVLVTGGYESNLVFLYFFPVLVASAFLPRRHTITVSLVPLFLYLIIAFLHYYYPALLLGIGIDTPFDHATFFTYLLVYSIAFLTIGFFSSGIAMKLKQTLDRLYRSEMNLARLEAVNELVVERLGECFIVIDRNRRIILTNRCCRDMLGSRLTQLLPQLDEGEGEQEVVVEGRYYRVRKILVDRAQGIKALIVSDLTAERERERQKREEERLATLGEMVGIFAHEIRNPLATIVNSLQIYEELEGEERKRLKQIIEAQVNKVNELIENFLSSKAISTEEWFELKEAVERIRKNAMFPSLRLKIDAGIYIRADRTKFEHALTVLLNQLLNHTRFPVEVSFNPTSDGFEIVLSFAKGKANLKALLQPNLAELQTGEGLPLLIAFRELREMGARLLSHSQGDSEGIKIKFEGKGKWRRS